MNNPQFITFEGIDGSGKTVQSRLLYDYLVSKGAEVVLTREPGGTNGAEEIRDLVLKGAEDRWLPITESLLYLAARSDHWLRKIKPALDAGKVVISDRFQDSTIVYQGIGKKVDRSFLNMVYQEFMKNREPDITFLIDISPEISIKRSLSRQGNDETRFENMDMEFHKKARESFLKLAEKNKRFVKINGELPVEQISSEIISKLSKLCALNLNS